MRLAFLESTARLGFGSGETLVSYLTTFNQKMKGQNRSVLLLLDSYSVILTVMFLLFVFGTLVVYCKFRQTKLELKSRSPHHAYDQLESIYEDMLDKADTRGIAMKKISSTKDLKSDIIFMVMTIVTLIINLNPQFI